MKPRVHEEKLLVTVGNYIGGLGSNLQDFIVKYCILCCLQTDNINCFTLQNIWDTAFNPGETNSQVEVWTILPESYTLF